MLTLVIALLILVGVALLVAEFFVFVGSAVAGIAGVIVTGMGVFLSYKYYGTTVGNFVLLLSLILFSITFYFSLRSKTWKKLALHSEVKGKVNTIEEFQLHEGDRGISISRLAPMGKVKIGNAMVEAKSLGGYIAENTEVEIIKVTESNIIVKPLN